MRSPVTARTRSVSRNPSIGVFAELLWGVEWSPPLIAFMYYFFVVTTFFQRNQ